MPAADAAQGCKATLSEPSGFIRSLCICPSLSHFVSPFVCLSLPPNRMWHCGICLPAPNSFSQFSCWHFWPPGGVFALLNLSLHVWWYLPCPLLMQFNCFSTAIAMRFDFISLSHSFHSVSFIFPLSHVPCSFLLPVDYFPKINLSFLIPVELQMALALSIAASFFLWCDLAAMSPRPISIS